ncbi:MAG TPA: GIY-YIG nuclease family protein [Chloroflexota bacterium]|nr:GIY-YIG nuclease family protein [Chloroflexota bacterium]
MITTIAARRAGTYVLLLELAQPVVLTVGRIGTFDFPAGWYAYVGSALAGIEQRVARHLRPSPVRHWHIDYLRNVADLRGVWVIYAAERLECRTAVTLLRLKHSVGVAPRFGGSDCQCPTHLMYFEGPPDREIPRQIERVLGVNLAWRDVSADGKRPAVCSDVPLGSRAWLPGANPGAGVANQDRQAGTAGSVSTGR